MSDKELIPSEKRFLDRIAEPGGEVDHYEHSYSSDGSRKLEVQVSYPETGERKFYVMKDKASTFEQREFKIAAFDSKRSRDAEITRLVDEEDLTQSFVGKIFGISQPRVSGIVRKKK